MSQALNQIELQKLKREVGELDTEIVEQLHAALSRMRRSERLAIFGKLQIGKLTTHPSLSKGVLSVLTIEDLVLRGAINVCRMLGSIEDEAQQLLELIERFLAGDDTDLPLGPGPQPAIVGEDRREEVFPRRSQAPIYSSVEADRLITEAIESLRSYPDQERLKAEKVGDYWDSTVVSGPFIEELSFRELSEMEPDHLLKKRSFGHSKIFNLSRAVKLFLGETVRPVQQKTAPAELHDFPTRESLEKSGTRSELDWYAGAADFPLLQKAMIAFVESQVQLCARGGEVYVALLSRVSERQLSAELSLLLLSEALDAPEPLGLDASEERLESLRAQLLELARDTAPALIQHWETALQGPGMQVSEFAAPYRSQTMDDELQTLFTRVLLRSLSGSELRLGEEKLANYFSAQPSALDWIVSAVGSKLPKTSPELRAEFSLIASHIPFDELKPLLLKRFNYDHSQDLWLQEQAKKL